MRTPSTAALKHWFDYIESGHLIWKHSVGCVKKGDTAGTVAKCGYVYVSFQKKLFRIHRLIWVWHGNKLDPTLEIDHKDQNKLNNRIENLRQLTHSQNLENRTYHKAKHIYKAKGGRRPWIAKVKRHYIGAFFTEAEALAAVDSYKRTLKPDVRQPR